MELHAAVFGALQEGGISILTKPHRFLAYVMDLADSDDPVFVVFESNCDAELLSIFSDVAHNMSTDAALNAVNLATALLVDVRYIHPDIANYLACEIAQGLCDYSGTPMPSELKTSAVKSPSNFSNTWSEQQGSEEPEQPAHDDDTATVIQTPGTVARPENAGHSHTSERYPAPGRAQLKPRRIPVGIIAAIAVIVAVAGIAGFLVFSGRKDAAPAERSQSLAASEQSTADKDFVGIWRPSSINVVGQDPSSYDARFCAAKQGELTINDDGTFSRSVFPRQLEGTWELRDDSTIQLSTSAKENTPGARNDKDYSGAFPMPTNADKLVVTYNDGVEITYEKGLIDTPNEAFIGLWQIEELVEDGTVQQTAKDFERDRKAGWYTKFLDVHGTGEITLDNQSKQSSGR